MGGTWISPTSSATRQRPSSRRRTPSSMSIDTSCSTKSGLPSAATITRSRTAGTRPVCPSRLSTMAVESVSVSGSEHDPLGARRCGPVRPILEQVVARRRQEQGRGLEVGPGQLVEQVQEGRLGPVDVVDDDDERASLGEDLDQPADGPERLRQRERRGRQPRGRRDPVGDLDVAERARARRARPRSGGSSSRMSAARRTISTSGQNVIPLPYGRQRPRTTYASDATDARNSRVRRDFPTPASPMTRDRAAADGRRRRARKASRSRSISRSRPTIGVASGASTGWSSRTATSR